MRIRQPDTYLCVTRYLEPHGPVWPLDCKRLLLGEFLGKLFKRDKLSCCTFDLLLATWVLTPDVEECYVDREQS